MADHGCDADSITRWAIRKSYRIHNPTPDQVARYRFWHHVSRTVGFDASGPWECWLEREIPNSAVVPQASPKPAPAPVVRAANGKRSLRPRRRGYPRGAPARARTLLHDRLADGPKPGAEIKAEAQTLDIPERSLIKAADALGVRTRRGEWWLKSG